MTTQKDFKKLVRARMQKTGERYTAARARLIASSSGSPAGAGQRAAGSGSATAASPDYAKLAGPADDTIKAKTGCTWDKWVWALDQVNASEWPHREIARYVHEKYKIPGWWAQSVTVGYERIKGLREKGQRRGGMWEASKSRTVAAGVGTVFGFLKEPRRRRRWLGDMRAVVRTFVPNKSVRLTWEDGTSVEAYLVSKGRSKTQLTIQHTRLPSRDMRDRVKGYWDERLDALEAALASTRT